MAAALRIARADAYRNFRFDLVMQGEVVAGLSKVSGLTRSTAEVQWRPGENPLTPKAVGTLDWDPVTLERGLTVDKLFVEWAERLWTLPDQASPSLGREVDTVAFRRTLLLRLFNESGQIVAAYRIMKAWPSEFTALPDLDATGTAVAIESLVLQHEGWERITVTGDGPAEP